MSTDDNIRWLHLSDFHVGKDDYAQRRMFEYIVAHVADQVKQARAPDFVFVTGDLANRGQEEEYLSFWLDFVDPLNELLGDRDGQRVFVVPGNHDVDRAENDAFSREEMTKPGSHYFDPSAEGLRLRGIVLPRFAAYAASDLSAIQGAFTSPAGSYATVRDVGGFTVGIAGINTAWLSKDDDDEQRLTPGKPLLEHALAQLAEVDLTIVLGHHPLDSFVPSQQKAITSLLGRVNAVYLHGHLHDHWCQPTYGGDGVCLAIQSGAAFQSREGERWRNGLVWGEVRPGVHELRLQPWHWTPEHQSWTLAADAYPDSRRDRDWWVYDLPASARARRRRRSGTSLNSRAPQGWRIAGGSDLEPCVAPLGVDQALRFFDGAVPAWEQALSSSIPRRSVVQSVAARFESVESAARPVVVLLLGPAGEGKTTALLQAAHAIANADDEWRILRRVDDVSPLVESELLRAIDDEHRWLLVIDEADRVARDLVAMLTNLRKHQRHNVHALIACRDSDWRGSGSADLAWSAACALEQERLSGLELDDATAIVGAWETFGSDGLGDLAQAPADDRAQLLYERARDEAAQSSEAFFGALLTVRHGTDLPRHARLLLDRLQERAIGHGQTLKDAFTYIALMHSENLALLSRPVLAEVLGCETRRLHRDVLAPLGEEAAASATSSFIDTRHRRIAETVIAVLKDEFAEDTDELFVRLAAAAIDVFKRGEYVPELAGWRFHVARHLFDTNRPALAFAVAEAVLAREPDHVRDLVHLASLYREGGDPERAIGLCRSRAGEFISEPSFYREWAVSEGANGNDIAGVALCALSLSDQCPGLRIDNDGAKNGLASLGLSLGRLFHAYHDDAFLNARAAVAVIGLELRLDPTTRGYLERYLSQSRDDGAVIPEPAAAFEPFLAGYEATKALVVDDESLAVARIPATLTFAGLEELVRSAESTRGRRAS